MTNPLVAKVWNYCNTLRDDGVDYDDCLEELPYFQVQVVELTLTHSRRSSVPVRSTSGVTSACSPAAKAANSAGSSG